jgi:hypothetical protein
VANEASTAQINIMDATTTTPGETLTYKVERNSRFDSRKSVGGYLLIIEGVIDWAGSPPGRGLACGQYGAASIWGLQAAWMA